MLPHTSMKALLLGLWCGAFCLGLPSSAQALVLAGDQAGAETVIVLRALQLSTDRHSSFFETRPGRWVSVRSVHQACHSPGQSADALLLYFPDSNRCEEVSRAQRLTLERRLIELTGLHPPANLLARLETEAVTLAPPPRVVLNRGLCSCPDNNAPEGSVGCLAQVKDAGHPIASIDFVATDVDGDALAAEFSYQLGSDPVQAGLPAPLLSNCTNGPGSLQCRISGPAPAEAGDLALSLAVSDGIDSIDLSAQLQVLAVIGEPIFSERFEPDLPLIIGMAGPNTPLFAPILL